jgi:methyl-accepting chemotaxis protein
MNRFLRRLSTAQKLAVLVVSAMGCLALLAVRSHGLLATQLMTERQIRIRSVVDTVHGVLAHFGRQEADGRLTREQAQAAAIQTIRGLRYEGTEYLWINDLHPRMIMHPTRPELDGKDVTDDADPKGKKLFQAFVQTVREKGAGFVDYEWPRPGADRPVPKLSYVKGYEPWGWILGSGVYLDDVAAALAAQRRDLVLVAFAIFLGLGLFAWVVALSITGALADAVHVAARVADGDLAVEGEVVGDDEPARLQSAQLRMATRLQKVVQEVSGAAAVVATAAGVVRDASQRLQTGAASQAGGLGRSRTSAEELVESALRASKSSHAAEQLAERLLAEAEELARFRETSPPLQAAIGRIGPLAREAVARVAEAASLADREVAAMQWIGTALRRLDSAGEQQRAAATELATGAEDLAVQAETLQRAVSFFRPGRSAARTPMSSPPPAAGRVA